MCLCSKPKSISISFIPLLLIASLVLHPQTVQAVEFEIATIDSSKDIVKRVVKRIGNKSRIETVTKEIKPKLFNTTGAIGKERYQKPIKLDFSLIGEPDLSSSKSALKHYLNLSASRDLAKDGTDKIEVLFKHTDARINSVSVLYKVSF